jgi:hypothetical protein
VAGVAEQARSGIGSGSSLLFKESEFEYEQVGPMNDFGRLGDQELADSSDLTRLRDS